MCSRYGFVRCAFADAMRDMLEAMLLGAGMDHALLYERTLKEQPAPELHHTSPRMMMQTLGDWGRNLHPDWWITQLGLRMGLQPGGTPVHDRIVITDVRLMTELDFVRALGGRLIGITRPHPHDVRPHATEQHVDTLQPDKRLANDGDKVHHLYWLVDTAMADWGIEPAEPVLAR